jgi:hypothetical protein
MSNSQFAFLNRSAVPDRASLQASIDALGFELKLHPGFTPFEDSGFLPCTLKGEEGPGFEIFYEESAEIVGEDDDFKLIADGRDYCISMVWRGSMKDLACVMIVSCALVKDFGAVVSYEGEAPEPLPKLLEATQGIVNDAASEA